MWFELLFVAVGAVIFVALYREMEDEPFMTRISIATFAGVGWGAFVIICALYLVIDAAAAIAKVFRK